MVEVQRGTAKRSAPEPRAKGVDAANAPFQLKGSSFKLMVLKVLDPARPGFFDQLKETVSQAPSFFHRQPIVIDLGEHQGVDLLELVSRLKALHLAPVGAQTTSAEVEQRIRDAGLAVIPAGRPSGKNELLPPKEEKKAEPEAREAMESEAAAREAAQEEAALKEAAQREAEGSPEKPVEVAAPIEEPQSRASMVVSEPIRSGRQVYAPKSDLIVLGPVSPGAELLADGHIHVYDTLRGRALAGLSGDRTARIFCRRLEAELVSIAGLYKVSEDIDRTFWKTSTQIHLNADRLCFLALP